LTEPIEPIEIAFEVACSPEHAFDTWANQTSLWSTTITIVHRGWKRLGADALAWRQRNLGG
jgi:hypothetical protein